MLNQVFVAASGRSWWSVIYSDYGKVIHEWQYHPGGGKLVLPNAKHSSTSCWEELPKTNIGAVILHCPNGDEAVIENPPDNRVFQFKIGHIELGINGASSSRQWCSAHIIGVVLDSDGNCEASAWEPVPGRLIRIKDNIYDFKYHSIGKLSIPDLKI